MNRQSMYWGHRTLYGSTHYTIFLFPCYWYIEHHTVLRGIPASIYIRFQHLRNHILDRVRRHVHAPAELADRVKHDGLTQATARLERIPRLRAQRAETRARTLRDRVRVVEYMRYRRQAEARDGCGPGCICGIRRGKRREGKAQALGGETLPGGLKGYGGKAEGGAEEGGERATEGVPNEPDSGGRVKGGKIVDEVLASRSALCEAAGFRSAVLGNRLCGS